MQNKTPVSLESQESRTTDLLPDYKLDDALSHLYTRLSSCTIHDIRSIPSNHISRITDCFRQLICNTGFENSNPTVSLFASWYKQCDLIKQTTSDAAFFTLYISAVNRLEDRNMFVITLTYILERININNPEFKRNYMKNSDNMDHMRCERRMLIEDDPTPDPNHPPPDFSVNIDLFEVYEGFDDENLKTCEICPDRGINITKKLYSELTNDEKRELMRYSRYLLLKNPDGTLPEPPYPLRRKFLPKAKKLLLDLIKVAPRTPGIFLIKGDLKSVISVITNVESPTGIDINYTSLDPIVLGSAFQYYLGYTLKGMWDDQYMLKIYELLRSHKYDLFNALAPYLKFALHPEDRNVLQLMHRMFSEIDQNRILTGVDWKIIKSIFHNILLPNDLTQSVNDDEEPLRIFDALMNGLFDDLTKLKEYSMFSKEYKR